MDTLNIEKYGFNHTGNIFRNNPPGALVEKALLHKEGRLSRAGALCIETGERTGRSPDDKYIVDTPAVHDLIAWGNVNRPVSSEVFDKFMTNDQYLNVKIYIFLMALQELIVNINMVLELSMKKQVKIYLLETYLFDLKRNN